MLPPGKLVLLRKLVASSMSRMPNTHSANWTSQPIWPPPARPAGCVEIVPLALLVSLILAQAPPTLPPT